VGLLPSSSHPSQQDEEDAIGFGVCRPFHLPPEDDQRLSQEGIFGEKLGLASAKIAEGGQRQRGPKRFGPMRKARGECMPAAIHEAPEMGQHTSHTRNFSITSEYRHSSMSLLLTTSDSTPTRLYLQAGM